MSEHTKASTDVMRWGCGHVGPSACAQCFDRILDERNLLEDLRARHTKLVEACEKFKGQGGMIYNKDWDMFFAVLEAVKETTNEL